MGTFGTPQFRGRMGTRVEAYRTGDLSPSCRIHTRYEPACQRCQTWCVRETWHGPVRCPRIVSRVKGSTPGLGVSWSLLLGYCVRVRVYTNVLGCEGSMVTQL